MIINSSGQGLVTNKLIKLLWENEDRYTSFTTKSITIDANEYRFLIISVCSSISVGTQHLWNSLIINSDEFEYQYISTKEEHRPVTITENGLIFGSCVDDPLTGTSASNDHVIPYRVYGLR